MTEMLASKTARAVQTIGVRTVRYLEPVFRPPSEAYSYILQVTYGCTHNKCTFCGMYRNKTFRVRPFEEVEEDIKQAAKELPETRRVFLADGDAMVLKYEKLVGILETLKRHLPSLARVGIYTDAKGLLSKSDEELRELKKRKLGIVYLGLESGSNEVLRRVHKECTAEEMTEAVLRAKAVGIKTSVIGLLGIAGKELSEEHARETGRVVSAMSPNYYSALTLTIVPNTELGEDVRKGRFVPLTPEESLRELYGMVESIRPTKSVIFRTNHASNYISLEGNLPDDRERILNAIRHSIDNKILRPEWMRGL